MKIFLVILISFVHFSCASIPIVQKISFASVKKLDTNGQVTKEEIIRKYGNPSEDKDIEGDEYLVYEENGFTRAKFVISKNNNTLNGILWFPRENEIEFKVSDLLREYGKENFSIISTPSGIPHSPMPHYQYLSDKYKMRAYSERNPEWVDFIVLADIVDRTPAALPVRVQDDGDGSKENK